MNTAIAFTNLTVVQMLIEAKADVNLADTGSTSPGDTPLHSAASKNLPSDASYVKTILDAKASINARTLKGKNAVTCAAASNSVAALKLLLHSGGEISPLLPANEYTPFWNTPLLSAALSPAYSLAQDKDDGKIEELPLRREACTLLISHGASPSEFTKHGVKMPAF